MEFDFGDSPVSPEWKDKVTSLLNSMPEVFAQNDLDFGHTNKVKHHIKLSDETAFKHRARPIHPQDVDAVRKHLQELLTAGIRISVCITHSGGSKEEQLSTPVH